MPDKRWTEDHGPDTYRQKFQVIQKKTGIDLSETEVTFVLRPETDPAALAAVLFYCHITDTRYPNRNYEIRQKMSSIILRELS